MQVGGGVEEGVCAKDVCWEIAQFGGELEACYAHFFFFLDRSGGRSSVLTG